LSVPGRSVALATLLIISAYSPVLAQSTAASTSKPAAIKGEIIGRVVTSVGQAPIGFANVEVTPSGANTPAARASTANDGRFRIPGLHPGRYRVLIRALGYSPRDFPSIVMGASQGVDIGAVKLTAVALALQSVSVAAQRPDVQLSPDRNTFVVRDMPSTQGGTALDVLRNVPAVDVDIDNVVSLRGNSGVVVEINGRTSPMKPAQLGDFLAQLPAAIVDKVEVIPNPSARDDPTGVAGIINIVLKQKADAGTSGGVTVGAGTTGHVDVGGNVGYQSGPLSMYGSYSFLRDNRPRNESVYRENNYLVPMTFLEESALRTQIPLAHTLTGSATYKLGNNDELSNDMMYSTRAETESYGILYHDLNSSRALTAASDRMTRDVNHEIEFESTLGYKHTFADKGHTLSSELRVFRNREGGPNTVVADTLPIDGSPAAVTALESQTGWAHPHENSFKVDYVRPLSKYVRLETGYKGSLQDFHTTLNTQVFDAALSAYQPDSTRISDFTYRQLVNSAYGMFDAQEGKFLLQGGVRLERATTKFHLNLKDATYNNLYNSIFPSALIAYNIDDSRQIKLSYSTRIQRPDDTDLLDPTPRYADPLNLSRGNPYLKPEYIRAFELGVQRTAGSTTLQITPFYRHTLNAITTLRSIDSAGVSTRTFANVATTDAYGTDANLALSGERLSGFAGTSLFREVSNAPNLAAGLNVRTFGWNARTNVSFRATSTLDLQALLFYRSAMTVAQGRNASRSRFSVAARQKLMDNRMSLTLRVIDPFSMSRERSTTVDPLFYQVSDRTRTIRGLLLSINWMFGKQPKSEDNRILDQNAGG
jgi:outer membrane receptor protein involved in Fe transport